MNVNQTQQSGLNAVDLISEIECHLSLLTDLLGSVPCGHNIILTDKGAAGLCFVLDSLLCRAAQANSLLGYSPS